MEAFSLDKEQVWDPKHHVEKILGKDGEGDYTVACWEPGQTSPNHCHPHATEIYFCYSGGGKMNMGDGSVVDIVPGSFIVHPPGELHEYVNGPERSLLFRVRYGGDPVSRTKDWPSNPDWQPKPADKEYFGN